MFDTTTICRTNSAIGSARKFNDDPDMIIVDWSVKIAYLNALEVLSDHELLLAEACVHATAGNTSEEQLDSYNAFYDRMADRFEALIQFDLHAFYHWWNTIIKQEKANENHS